MAINCSDWRLITTVKKISGPFFRLCQRLNYQRNKKYYSVKENTQIKVKLLASNYKHTHYAALCENNLHYKVINYNSEVLLLYTAG